MFEIGVFLGWQKCILLFMLKSEIFKIIVLTVTGRVDLVDTVDMVIQYLQSQLVASNEKYFVMIKNAASCGY